MSAARTALEEVEAGHLADRGVAEMSGGERARVLLARALTTGAQALLADEPTAGLDPEAQLMVMERLRARAAAGQAVLVSLHDLALAARFADRIVVLDAGRVVADAAPLAALTPEVMARTFGLAARWVDGPDGPLLSSGRYSIGSPTGA
jgi:iron complex transport system ATP-binding protein